jgi:hypothetical protein
MAQRRTRKSKGAMSLSKRLSRLERETREEIKYVTYQYDALLPIADSVNPMYTIAQGIAINQRIGLDIIAKRIRIALAIENMSISSVLFRIVVVTDTSHSQAATAMSSLALFNTPPVGNTMYKCVAPWQPALVGPKNRYRIHFNRVYELTATGLTGPGVIRNINTSVRLNADVQYNTATGGLSALTNTSTYVILYCNVNNAVYVSGELRLDYTDS